MILTRVKITLSGACSPDISGNNHVTHVPKSGSDLFHPPPPPGLMVCIRFNFRALNPMAWLTWKNRVIFDTIDPIDCCHQAIDCSHSLNCISNRATDDPLPCPRRRRRRKWRGKKKDFITCVVCDPRQLQIESSSGLWITADPGILSLLQPSGAERRRMWL